ncbi:MAG TPA: ribosome-associated translation inhibitor RaiA [Thermoanaerobaculia bacterium]|nr:ribosome-associated translation inhibitor RaiA [Thermoanaerobaculia bacterium]
MKIDYVSRSFTLDDGTRSHIESKLEKLVKFLEEPIEVHVALDSERHHQIAELHVAHRHGALQAREASDQILDSVNQAIDKAERQARRSRKKLVDRRRRPRRSGGEAGQWPIDVVDRQSVGEGRRPRVIKSSLLRIKPMSIDEAALELDASRHDFVVFRDAETDRVSVLYKRKDENFGLIAPEF